MEISHAPQFLISFLGFLTCLAPPRSLSKRPAEQLNQNVAQAQKQHHWAVGSMPNLGQWTPIRALEIDTAPTIAAEWSR